MSEYVVTKISNSLNERKKSVKGSLILILGVAYKKDVRDSRESPAIEIIEILLKKGAKVFYNDPYIPELKVDKVSFKSISISEKSLREADCVTIVTDHRLYDYRKIVKTAHLIIDTRNATKGILKGRKRVVRL